MRQTASSGPLLVASRVAGRPGVLLGEQNVVEPTPAIAVRSRVCLVLRCRADFRVRFFTAFGRFNLYVGPLEHSDSVCHGFPTEGEARVYAKAAFVDFPSLSNGTDFGVPKGP